MAVPDSRSIEAHESVHLREFSCPDEPGVGPHNGLPNEAPGYAAEIDCLHKYLTGHGPFPPDIGLVRIAFVDACLGYKAYAGSNHPSCPSIFP